MPKQSHKIRIYIIIVTILILLGQLYIIRNLDYESFGFQSNHQKSELDSQSSQEDKITKQHQENHDNGEDQTTKLNSFIDEEGDTDLKSQQHIKSEDSTQEPIPSKLKTVRLKDAIGIGYGFSPSCIPGSLDKFAFVEDDFSFLAGSDPGMKLWSVFTEKNHSSDTYRIHMIGSKSYQSIYAQTHVKAPSWPPQPRNMDWKRSLEWEKQSNNISTPTMAVSNYYCLIETNQTTKINVSALEVFDPLNEIIILFCDIPSSALNQSTTLIEAMSFSLIDLKSTKKWQDMDLCLSSKQPLLANRRDINTKHQSLYSEPTSLVAAIILRNDTCNLELFLENLILLGFDQVYVYTGLDMETTTLHQYLQSGLVTLIPWQEDSRNPDSSDQFLTRISSRALYNDALYRLKFKWMYATDAQEILFFPELMDKQRFNATRISQMIGTTGILANEKRIRNSEQKEGWPIDKQSAKTVFLNYLKHFDSDSLADSLQLKHYFFGHRKNFYSKKLCANEGYSIVESSQYRKEVGMNQPLRVISKKPICGIQKPHGSRPLVLPAHEIRINHYLREFKASLSVNNQVLDDSAAGWGKVLSKAISDRLQARQTN